MYICDCVNASDCVYEHNRSAAHGEKREFETPFAPLRLQYENRLCALARGVVTVGPWDHKGRGEFLWGAGGLCSEVGEGGEQAEKPNEARDRDGLEPLARPRRLRLPRDRLR